MDSGTDVALGNIFSFTEQLLTRLHTILSILLPENGLILTSLKVLLHYISTYSGEHFVCVCVCVCARVHVCVLSICGLHDSEHLHYKVIYK